MFWPTNTDYQEAIQNPHLCFSDPELKNGVPQTDGLGLPRPTNGYFSTVYQLNCGNKRYAVKCFLRYFPDQEKRYAKISRHLQGKNLDYMVEFKFLKEGIQVRGRWYPVLKMQWVDGECLNTYLQHNLHNQREVFDLAQRFLRMMHDLRKNSIAHGDLQHGNILVVNGGLKLIDYDGMFVPSLKGMRGIELGHRNFQHPVRSENDFGVYLDNFSSWVIYLSLLALSCDPNLWRRSGAGDECLILRKEDFLDPASSPVFNDLNRISNSAIQHLAEQVRSFAGCSDLTRIPYLETRQFEKIDYASIHRRLPGWIDDHVAAKEVSCQPDLMVRPEAWFLHHLKPDSSDLKTGEEFEFRKYYGLVIILLGVITFFLIWGALDLIITSDVLR